MKQSGKLHFPHCQTGLGLVEVMVGLALGLVMLAAIGYVFLASQQTTKTQDDLSRMQETARLTLDTIGQYARNARYTANPSSSFQASHGAGMAWLEVTDGGGSGAAASPDTLTIRYDAMVTGDTDCTGTNVAGGAMPPNPITAVFSLNGTDLRCGNGATNATMFSNIENMQVEYGVDNNSDHAVDNYVTGTSISATQLDGVLAVRVRLLVRSERDDVSPVNQVYSYNGESVTAGDRRLRQEYVATFALRNRLP